MSVAEFFDGVLLKVAASIGAAISVAFFIETLRRWLFGVGLNPRNYEQGK